MEIDRLPWSPTDLSDVIDSAGWWQIGGVTMGNDLSLEEEACMYVHVRLHESGWTFKYWANSLRFTERAWCTPPYQSPFTERERQRSSERRKLSLSNHLFRLLFSTTPHHTCFSFLPPSCICSFLEHLQSSFSPMKLLVFVHLITTLTYPTCCVGYNIRLMKHIRSPTRHAHAHTATCLSAHSWHTYWLLNSFHSNVKWLTIMYSVMAGNDKHCPVVHQHQSFNIFCSPTNVLQAKKGKDSLCRSAVSSY